MRTVAPAEGATAVTTALGSRGDRAVVGLDGEPVLLPRHEVERRVLAQPRIQGERTPSLGHRGVLRLDHDIARRGRPVPHQRKTGGAAADRPHRGSRRAQVDRADLGVARVPVGDRLDAVVVRLGRVAQAGEGHDLLRRRRRRLGVLERSQPHRRLLRRGEDPVGARAPHGLRPDGHRARRDVQGARAARERRGRRLGHDGRQAHHQGGGGSRDDGDPSPVPTSRRPHARHPIICGASASPLTASFDGSGRTLDRHWADPVTGITGVSVDRSAVASPDVRRTPSATYAPPVSSATSAPSLPDPARCARRTSEIPLPPTPVLRSLRA